jgi:hypothetical protein
LYFLSLKSFRSNLVNAQVGEYLNWARLPDSSIAQALQVQAKSKLAHPAQVTPQPSVPVPPRQN